MVWKLISYADSSGGVNILGPKMAEQVVEAFTYEFMKKERGLQDWTEGLMILLFRRQRFLFWELRKRNSKM